MYLLNPLKKKLENILKDFKIVENLDLKISNNLSYDLQINNLVKQQKNKKIEEITSKFIEEIEKDLNISDYEITKDYFINLNLDLNRYLDILENVETNIKVKKQKKIIIDYGGPNIGKPLHVGHLRSLNIGRSLYNINKIAGNKILSDIHLGDWGMPVAQIINFCENKGIDIEKLEIAQLEEIYPSASSLYKQDINFQETAKNINKKLNDSDPEYLKKWMSIKNISLDSIKKMLGTLNHTFDLWLGESDVNKIIPKMLKDLEKNKKISLENGAYVSNEKTDPKILITKSDGSYLYLTTDLATVLDRLDNLDFDAIFYVVDKRQKLHFEQLFNSLDYFQFEHKHYEHVSFGTINDRDGNPFKTREGGTKQLKELLDETKNYINEININLDFETVEILANTVLTYSDLITNRQTDYKFDLKRFTNISGKTGIYIQYALVRAKKLISDSDFSEDNDRIDISKLDKQDTDLLKALFKFEILFKKSIENNEPHHIADYLYEISNLFNAIYQSENILNNNNKIVRTNKLTITNYFVRYSLLLQKCLGIKPVSKM